MGRSETGINDFLRRHKVPKVLSARYKFIIELRNQGLTNRQIATELGLSVSTIAIYLSRFRKQGLVI